MSATAPDSPPAVARASFTPLQERTLALLRRSAEPVEFDRAFVDEIVGELTQVVATLAAELEAHGSATDSLYVSKHALSTVFGCEVQARLPDQFSWTIANAVGQVAHRAIHQLVHWRGEPVPADLVDDALERIIDDDRSLGAWLAGIGEHDRAELRAAAVEKVTKFDQCFPPLPKRSQPMTEASLRWPNDGPIVLAGKVDLVVGRPEGAMSTKLIVDLKTGRVAQRHRDDLRYYALLETLVTRVPPRRLASYYLDAGDPHVEDVTEAVLRSAARRTVDGVRALVDLTTARRQPVKRVGAHCRWCPLTETCREGRTYLGADTDDIDP